VTDLDRQAPLPPALAEGLAAALAVHGGPPAGAHVLYFPMASSTNDLAARTAEQGAPDGTIVIAGQQTAGRGRAGHSWFSPPGAGLYLSMVVDARLPDASSWVPALTLTAGVAVAEALHAASGLPVAIKWPNDLVMAPAGAVRGARKLAGILAEARSDGGGRLTHVIVGVGVNVRAAAWPPDISARATSLEEELGRPVDVGAVLGDIVARLGVWLDRLRAGERALVRSRWQRLSVGATGAAVAVPGPEGTQRGLTAGLDADGALLVRCGTAVTRVVAGEVTWL
jgi:BirA family biotin operon repressor/biotin-[acetyl-CoA-carboxylase] ligase